MAEIQAEDKKRAIEIQVEEKKRADEIQMAQREADKELALNSLTTKGPMLWPYIDHVLYEGPRAGVLLWESI